MRKRHWLLLSVLACSIGVSAQAGVIDFETGAFLLSLGDTGRLQGFNFTAGGQPSSVILAPVMAANCNPNCISNGTRTLGAFNGANVTIDPVTPGELFALDSFDVAGTATSGSNRNVTSIQVIGNLAGGGQVTQTFIVDPDAPFQTETLDPSFRGLSSVEFDGLLPAGLHSPEFQLDNIMYSAATTGSATPEPASLLLIATGLCAAPFAPRRRKLL